MATFSLLSLLLEALALQAWGSQPFVRRELHVASVAASGTVLQTAEVLSPVDRLSPANKEMSELAQELLASSQFGNLTGAGALTEQPVLPPLSTEAPVVGKVYEVHFKKGNTQMCWMKELPNCMQSSQACDLEYCPVGGISKLGNCECMQVMVRSCKVGENPPHTQIWSQATAEYGFTAKSRFWRAVRMKYLDSQASLGVSATDKGQLLESDQVCNSESCECDKSHWYRWLLDEGKIKWAAYTADNETAGNKEKAVKQQSSGVSIGPVPNNPIRNATMTLKAFNVLDPVGNMYFVLKNMGIAEQNMGVLKNMGVLENKDIAEQNLRL